VRKLPAFGLDLVCVVAFVVAGRGSHAGDGSGRSLLVVLAPFLVGLTAGWLVLLVSGARADGWRGGAAVWALTLSVGMALRALVFDGGVAASFVLVAGTFLAASMFGWRLLWHVVLARRRRQLGPATHAGV
jgi:hypothetical protein